MKSHAPLASSAVGRSSFRLLSSSLLFVTLAGAAVSTKLDVKSMLDLGWVQSECTTLDLGQVGDVFDGNTDTVIRTMAINPLVLTLTFTEPQHFDGFRLCFLGGTNRWQVEMAANLADLDGQDTNTTYRVLVPIRADAEGQWAAAKLPSYQSGKLLRLTLSRVSGDDYVHLCDWEIQHQLRLELTPVINTLSGYVCWSAAPYNYYALQQSTNLADWTNLACGTPRLPAMTNGPVSLASNAMEVFRLAQLDSANLPFVTKKVLILNFDPVLTNHGGLRLHEYCGWGDPRQLTSTYLADLTEASSNYVRWEPTFVDVNAWPVKQDGFAYDETSYLDARSSSVNLWHSPDNVDYERIIQDFDLDRRVKSGEVDEVIIWGGPYFGYWESHMVGASAYWCNSSGNVHAGVPLYVIMGLNYERGVDCALESFGHRSESILAHVYGSWNSGTTVKHLWDKFTRINKDAPGLGACGNVHYPPNGTSDYDYGNSTFVVSLADDWLLNYPNFRNTKRVFNAAEWNFDHRQYLKWWFRHMPCKPGRYSDGKLNNWWGYLVDFNTYPESR